MEKEELQFDGYPFKKAVDINGFRPRTNNRLRLAMIAAFKVCYWCGVECHDYEPVKGVRSKPDLGTIDHLVSRPVRNKGDTVLKVLACYRCNFDRSREQSRLAAKLYAQKDKELFT